LSEDKCNSEKPVGANDDQQPGLLTNYGTASSLCHASDKLKDWQRTKILGYIDEHIARPITVAELARQIHRSESVLFKAFRATFGTTPYAYILQRRVEKAKALLRSVEPLSHIGPACGLGDQSHFTKVFKRIAGTTPYEWRRQQFALQQD
jgi:AraC family transcriptional regulator